MAFNQLMVDFKKKGFNRLICSSMGYVQNNITIKHFINKIIQFHYYTGASVDLILYRQKSHRIPRNGMSHDICTKQVQ